MERVRFVKNARGARSEVSKLNRSVDSGKHARVYNSAEQSGALGYAAPCSPRGQNGCRLHRYMCAEMRNRMPHIGLRHGRPRRPPKPSRAIVTCLAWIFSQVLNFCVVGEGFVSARFWRAIVVVL